ncbi:hypothetical protein FACS1894110_21730 [Spirochaetia bacterium]|nr:hypothetical protein FACS1894110_21730 [Spirochaetia bacterium]
MKTTKPLVILFALCFVLPVVTYGQARVPAKMISFEFIDQNIRDILFSFSTYAKVPITADDTVSGTASFQFNGTSFEQAFDSFLLTNRLYADQTGEPWLVSRVSITLDDAGFITLNALDATPAQLLEKLSRRLGVTIIQDILPSTRLSLRLENSNAAQLAELIMKPFSDYSVHEGDNFIQIRKAPVQPYAASAGMGSGIINIREAGGLYDISIEQAKLGDVLERLFSTAKQEYASFARSDQLIERLRFGGKEFADALSLLLEQANSETEQINNIWYIFPLQQGEIIKKLKDEGKAWHKYELKYIPVAEFLPLMQSRFPGVQTIAVTGNTELLAFIDEAVGPELQGYIRTIDIPKHTQAIKLKYIRTEELFKYLPPSVKREELVDTGDGNTVFFLGTAEKLAVFQEDLVIIDRPRTRIRYDLFIMQFQDTSDLNWGVSGSARPMQPGDRTMVSGEFGNLLNINFDLITVFGYQFAARVNLALSENKASVFADTTLFGLSGQEIKFQNTNTYRYRDSNIDPDTGKPIYSGVTREIISGLILDIKGWVSGDGMITTNVTATVSKRGADVSSSIGNPPPTSERVLTTQVRSRSGETVVLSGLRQNDSTIVEDRLPGLSKIPLLGWLFKSRHSTKENTQMVIYLIPHIDLTNEEYTVEGPKIAAIYNKYVEPFLGGPHE